MVKNDAKEVIVWSKPAREESYQTQPQLSTNCISVNRGRGYSIFVSAEVACIV